MIEKSEYATKYVFWERGVTSRSNYQTLLDIVDVSRVMVVEVGRREGNDGWQSGRGG